MNQLFPRMFCITLLLGFFMPISNAEAAGFSITGSMTTAREVHTATQLSNGKALITGGWNSSSGYQNSAELYNPANDSFSATGSMITARAYHTATLLSNGKVLITGGYSFNGVSQNSAELYDPSNGSFSATGSMTTARYKHTATLLLNGKVLITGGYSLSGVSQSSAELYDPSSGTFSATGSMTKARSVHTATLLSTGKVLITGGYDGSSCLHSAELYDPATGVFSAIGGMTSVRSSHIATLLPTGKALITGGYDGSRRLSSAELYDPASGTFSATGNMTMAHSSHTATLLSNGKLLITGGLGSSDRILGSAELYDPATGLFSAAGGMTVVRYYHTATLLSTGKVLITGGCGDSYNTLGSAELYDPPPLLPTISGVPDATASVGITYNFTPISTNATSFSISGSLPPGIVFNSATGALSGTPTTVGFHDNIIISVTNANGSASLPAFSITVTSVKQLTVSLAGTGNGSVNSITPGLIFTCVQGACPAQQLPYNMTATLAATPSSTSLFSGWSGGCTNTSGYCQMTLDVDKSVTATFNAIPPLKIPGTSAYYYGTFAAALADTTAMPDNSSVTLYGQATTLTGGLILNRPVNINFAGGFDAGFQSNTGGAVTIITGGVKIRKGTLREKNFAVR